MATNPNDTAARKLVGKFARTLLATTCLTVATGGSAFAVCQYNEGTSLDQTFPTFTQLSATTNPGTTTVCGSNLEADNSFFELTGLGSGTYAVTATVPGESGGPFALYISPTAFSSGYPPSSGSVGDFGPANPNPLTLGAVGIPGSGDLFFDVNTIGEDSGSFTVQVTTVSTATPEPGTIPMMGLGLAGALALGRKRRKQ